jgi:RNA polymerase sigma-70 factor (ECF subfamily)
LALVANPAQDASVSSAVELDRLVTGMQSGQQAALRALYLATVGKVYALALAILRSEADAEEVAADTYAQAWSTAASFDPARANALGWLLMICRSRAIDRRRQRRAPTVDLAEIAEPPADDSSPEELLSLLQEGSLVRAALGGLSPERRRLVTMAFLQDMSHQEIADATGLPLGTVKSHLRRALTDLRAALG